MFIVNLFLTKCHFNGIHDNILSLVLTVEKNVVIAEDRLVGEIPWNESFEISGSRPGHRIPNNYWLAVLSGLY